MAAFGAADPTDRAAFDAKWMRILADPGIVVRAIEVDPDALGTFARTDGVGALAGSILLWRDPDLPGPEVSYWLGRAFWGRGVATEALRLFLAEVEVEVRPVFGRAAADNPGSIRVLEHCGFVRSGEDQGWSDALGRTVREVILRLDG